VIHLLAEIRLPSPVAREEEVAIYPCPQKYTPAIPGRKEEEVAIYLPEKYNPELLRRRQRVKRQRYTRSQKHIPAIRL
jgi:hypothetical protein